MRANGRSRTALAALFAAGAALASTAAVGRAAVTAAIENGFETSAPLEVGFVRVRLENSGKSPARATVEARAAGVMQEVELPPGSRKIVPLIASDPGPITVRAGGREIAAEQVVHGAGGSTILVISERETGMRLLEREQTPAQAVQARVSAGSGAAPPPSPGVQVYTVSPEDLPPSPFAYPSSVLLVIHPGGFDRATPEQREALRLAATYWANVVLVSEGKANAFRGTPLERLVPGRETGIASYDEWMMDFRGASSGPSAMTILEPDSETVTSQTTSGGLPLIVQRRNPKGGRVTWLAFDYSSPPLRSWSSKAFWMELATDGRFARDESSMAFAQSFLDAEAERRAYSGPSPTALGAVFLALALGYGAAAYAARRLRNDSSTYKNWVLGPALLAGVFVVACALGWSERATSLRSFETSLLLPVQDGAFARHGNTGFIGPGRISDGKLKSDMAMVSLVRDKTTRWGRVSIGPQMPPTVREAALDRRGVLTLGFREIVETSGMLEIAAETAASSATETRAQITNRTPFEVTEIVLFINGQYALLGDSNPGKSRSGVFALETVSSAAGGVQPVLTEESEDELREKRILESGARISRSYKPFAVGRVRLPAMLPGTQDLIQVLVAPVTVQ